MLCCCSCPLSKTKSLGLANQLAENRDRLEKISDLPISRNRVRHQKAIDSLCDRALSFLEKHRSELRRVHKSVRVVVNKDMHQILRVSRQNLTFSNNAIDSRAKSRRISNLQIELDLDHSQELAALAG